MLTDGGTAGRTDGGTDDRRKVITIAHPEHSSGELKITNDFFIGVQNTDIAWFIGDLRLFSQGLHCSATPQKFSAVSKEL